MISVKTISEEFLTLLQQVMTNVFPQAAVSGTKLPFIIYRRSNILNLNSKDSVYQMDCSFEIDIVTENYSIGLEKLDTLLGLLQRNSITNPSLHYNINIDSVTELYDYEQGLYVQRVGCTIHTTR